MASLSESVFSAPWAKEQLLTENTLRETMGDSRQSAHEAKRYASGAAQKAHSMGPWGA